MCSFFQKKQALSNFGLIYLREKNLQIGGWVWRIDDVKKGQNHDDIMFEWSLRLKSVVRTKTETTKEEETWIVIIISK